MQAKPPVRTLNHVQHQALQVHTFVFSLRDATHRLPFSTGTSTRELPRRKRMLKLKLSPRTNAGPSASLGVDIDFHDQALQHAQVHAHTHAPPRKQPTSHAQAQAWDHANAQAQTPPPRFINVSWRRNMLSKIWRHFSAQLLRPFSDP